MYFGPLFYCLIPQPCTWGITTPHKPPWLTYWDDKNCKTYNRGEGLKISCKIKHRNKTKEVLQVISVLAYFIHKLVNLHAYMFECLHTCIRAYLLTNLLTDYMHTCTFLHSSTFLLLYFGWWVNILGLGGGAHLRDGRWTSLAVVNWYNFVS